MERKMVFKALVGSHNYQINVPQSDKDYKIFVMPTFEDLYKGKFYSKATITDEMDMDVHDIRKLPKLFYKSNINFLEVLFSLEVHAGPAYEMVYKVLYNKREEIASMNLPYLYNACVGMSHQKIKGLDKYSEGMEYSKKFGYNIKEATHAYRLLNFLSRYRERQNFKSALWYKMNELDREIVMKIRTGQMIRSAMMSQIESAKNRAEQYEDWYKSQEPKEWLNDFLEHFIMGIVEHSIKTKEV